MPLRYIIVNIVINNSYFVKGIEHDDNKQKKWKETVNDSYHEKYVMLTFIDNDNSYHK